MRCFASAITRVTGTALLASIGAAACAAPGAGAAAEPLASASYGQAAVSIRENPASAGEYQLMYAPGQEKPAAVVDVQLPGDVATGAGSIGLGLDGKGLLTAVVQTPRGLAWTHVTKPTKIKRLANTAGAESPAIYRGQVAYVCRNDRAICGASLRTKARRTLYREPKGSQWVIDGVLIGPRRAIAVASVRDGALSASRVQIQRRGHRAKTVAEANLDGGKELILRDISPDGQFLAIATHDYFEAGDDVLSLYGFPSGVPAL